MGKKIKNERNARKMKEIFLILMAGVFVTACSGPAVKKTEAEKTVKERRRDKDGKLFGDGLTLWGSDRKRDVPSGSNGGGSGIGVNAHLWYAALDTVSFMPIHSADPFGGVIITDWYTPAQSPMERFKVNLFILDRLLRSDAIKITVFHEVWDGKKNQWMTALQDTKMATELENLVLTRARQLRISNPNGQ